MSRSYKEAEIHRRAKARRDAALARPELRGPSTPRVSAEGATSAAMKARDPETDRMVQEYLERRGK